MSDRPEGPGFKSRSKHFFLPRHERMMKVHNYKTQDSTSIPQGDTHIARALL